MRTIFDIIFNDLRIFFGQRGNWVSVVLLPMAFTALLGWAMSGVGGDATAPIVVVDVVDLDGTPASARFQARLQAANSTLQLCPAEPDAVDLCALDEDQTDLSVDESLARVQAGTTTALIVLPAGFEAAATGDQTARIQYYSLEDPTVPSPVYQSVQTAVQEANGLNVAEFAGMAFVDALLGEGEAGTDAPFDAAGAREEFVQRYRQSLAAGVETQPALVVFAATAPMAEGASLQGFAQAVPGMGTVFVMLTVLGGMVTLLNERRQWTLQRMVVAPIRRGQILAGKAGTYFLLGMIQFVIVFLVGAIVGIDLGSAPLALLAVMVAFVLCITGLTFALAPHMKSESQASGLARLLALTLAPLGGAWWPLGIVPPFMQTLGHLSPVAWAMDAFQTLIWYGGGFGDILVELGVLLTAAAVLFGIGVASFRIDD